MILAVSPFIQEVITIIAGMLATNNEDLAILLRSLRNHGAVDDCAFPEEEFGPWSMSAFPNLGYNLRLSDLQAAVGVAQFEKIDKLLAS